MKKILVLIILIGSSMLAYRALTLWWSFDTQIKQFGQFELLDKNGYVLAELPRNGGLSIPYQGPLDTPVITAIIEVEDRRFYSHHGIDVIGKIGALRENYAAGGIVRGGSTITEQYIKNRYFPGAPRTLWQKGRESLYALLLEIHSSKETILRGYVDTLYMGNGIYGINTASIIYFGGNIREEYISEVITRIKYPNLGEAAENYKEKISTKLGLKNALEKLEKREKPIYSNLFPLFTQRIETELSLWCSGRDNTLDTFLIHIPSDICESSNLSIRTSIDKNLMHFAENLLEGTIAPLQEKNVHNGSVLIWSEKEKKILAYIGNTPSQRDNAIDMITKRRSVGSTLKPFVYSLALSQGAGPGSYILDDTRAYETADTNISYVAENYIPKSYGPVTLREALGNSLNSATVRLSEHLGVGRIYDFYRKIGLDLDHDSGYYGYGISIGAVELTLEDIVRGYRHLTDLSDGDNFLIFDMLSDAGNRARTFGVSSILNTSIPLAVKTGTSTDFHDNWVVGYDEDIIMGVWIGNADNESMDDISGVTGAGPLYHGIAEYLISSGYITSKERVPPSGIVYTYICLDKKCLQKIGSYQKDGWQAKSNPINQNYFATDFFTPLTEEEKLRWKIR